MKAASRQVQFDELIHAPIRLRICASLAPLQWAEFAQLRDALEVADSVLSKHLKQLSEAGYVEVERFSKGGRSHVRVALTRNGRKAYIGHVAALRAMTDETT
ncbi:transcriptional regulator [Nesterenkonia sandarakina]|uniref:DNA-binding MarR family transcriptional regulator n=1 Tax=Nesterenkonia sandarakina TaxID=272918 RepID=A0A7Z0J4A0_9MICC|nr:transcriptional regulator [Nesterenkonia sandarakina]NYJ18172.1 DNA-binding MarR family transcriptional regulator [Nesterenkonia sandarakina]